MTEEARYKRSATHLQAAFGDAPDGAILLGSGGGPLVTRWEALSERLPYTQLDLPTTTVPGHAGTAGIMAVNGQRMLVLSGRAHRYEGHSNADLVCLIRALRTWGVQRAILTSAVGSLRADLPPGSLVRITDHINFTGNPLVGNHAESFARFPDLSRAYSPRLGGCFVAAAEAAGVHVEHGVYAMTSGPSYETPAEVRMLRMLGGDVVGMSMPTEVVAAAQIGLEILGVGVVSNFGSGLAPADLTHEEVLEVVGAALTQLAAVIEGVLARW